MDSTMKDGPLEGDDARLAAMGHRPELQRSHSTWSMLGLAFAVLNSWTALSASLSISLTSGGSTSVIWGLVDSIIGLQLSYVPQRWHQFLIYIGLTLGSFIINAFMNSILPVIYRGAFMWSIGGFVVVSIAVLACASPNYNSAYFVFCDFINTTGWPDGVAWLLGLLQGGLGVTAFDAVAHMIEEVPNADIEGPKIMVSCVGIGTVTGSIFLIVLLFVAGNMEQVTTSAAGPLLQILIDATKSNAGAICLLMLPLVCLVFAIISVMTTSSRMIFAFARDGGLPASRFFATVHPTLKLPLNALILSVIVVIAFGCIFLGSSSAFNAIISASVVALDISYGIPIAINCLQGRRSLPERKWKLPNAVGWFADLVGLTYIILTTVLFVFPPSRTVTGSSMNYCIAAFAVIVIISVFQWMVDGRKNFAGPRIDMNIDALDSVSMREETEPNIHEKGRIGPV
ncbi:Amino acid/polyamine transporter I [Penicillium soppii]|uniref:Amino acid/polyamine transporter I n=1 Tax=Penicillium soppii TaxID=69789 RepID=UPI002547323F|nr:Amino acid/polyamine transporter I [Penicillium soppii]KAJ5865405.1 Amino acid/polyamine transporter I [Penicillium soppii]